MFYKCSFGVLMLSLLMIGAIKAAGQSIPDDAVHLPKKIGGEDKSNDRLDAVNVTGKITVNGLTVDEKPPKIFVAVYSYGRFITRKVVEPNGSFSIADVPRNGSVLSVEIDQTEVASAQVIPGPSMIHYQDFQISMPPRGDSRTAIGVVDAMSTYVRDSSTREIFQQAVNDLNKGNTDKAISSLKKVVSADVNDFPAWTQLGNAHFIKKNYKEAEDSYLRSIALRPGYVLPHINLGKLYLIENRPESAVGPLTKAVEVGPSSADAQHFLGEAYLALKKGSKAVVYLNEAIRLAPVEKAEIHLRLAALYDAVGLKSRASFEYKLFLEKIPGYGHAADLKKYIAANPPKQ